MAKVSSEWTVREHGELEALSDNLWRVEGTVPGMALRRVMTVARTRAGKLVLHSAIALDEQRAKQLEALGEFADLLVPNGFHRLDAAAYKKRYPALRVFAPRGSRAKVEQVVKVDGTYEDFPNDESVRLLTLPGTGEAEGAMLVFSSDGVSVVLNDVVFNMDKPKSPLGFLLTTLLGSAPGPRVSRLAKLALVKDKRALRSELERLGAMPELVRLVVSHDKVAKGGAASEALQRAATYL